MVKNRIPFFSINLTIIFISFFLLGNNLLFCPAARAQEPKDVSMINLSAQPNPPRMMEAYPEDIQARLEFQERSIRNLEPAPLGMGVQYVIRNSTRWNPGQTLKVAFRGGDSTLHREIAEVAKQWTEYGNIILDFGVDPQTGEYRTWSPNDQTYKAEIRISFNYGGYWSLVGTNSINPGIVKPRQPSMNFGGFLVARPSDWATTVLHEFGHALGFEHEHQHPIGGCDLEFRWDDDPGYQATFDAFGQFIPDDQGRRPGIYTLLGGPPNNWQKSKVEFNLKQITSNDSHAFLVSSFDDASIMKYFFEKKMFVNGEKSHCYSPQNNTLSSLDKNGIALAYPFSRETAREVFDRQEIVLRSFSNNSALSQNETAHYKNLLESLSAVKATMQ